MNKAVERRLDNLEKRSARRSAAIPPEVVEACRWMRWCWCDELDAYERILSSVVADGRDPTPAEQAQMDAIERIAHERIAAGDRSFDEMPREEYDRRWYQRYWAKVAEQRAQRAQHAASGVVSLDEHRARSRP